MMHSLILGIFLLSLGIIILLDANDIIEVIKPDPNKSSSEIKKVMKFGKIAGKIIIGISIVELFIAFSILM